MIYAGFDPGASGAMAIIYEDGTADIVPYDEQEYIVLLKFLALDNQIKAAVEQVHSMPGEGSVSSFSFGTKYGFLHGMLKALGIPFELVRPQKWKKEFGCTSDKETSIEVCKRLFPAVNLKRTERCRKEHDGMAEALLIAEYARRHMK